MQEVGEVQQIVLGHPIGRFADDQLRMSDDIIQFAVTHFGQMFAYFFGQEGEKIHQILIPSEETLAQRFILRGDTNRACIHVAFAHHHTTQDDQRRGGKTKFLCSEQGHQYDITPCFQLSVCLQAYLTTQAVHHQCLLRLR